MTLIYGIIIQIFTTYILFNIAYYLDYIRIFSKFYIFRQEIYQINPALNKKYSLSNLTDFYVPSISIFNDNGNKQFNYFFSRFINEIMNANEIETDFDIF